MYLPQQQKEGAVRRELEKACTRTLHQGKHEAVQELDRLRLTCIQLKPTHAIPTCDGAA